MHGYRVTASISLAPADGETGFSLPSGTPSVLAVFATVEGQLQFGTTITTQDGDPLVPESLHPAAVLEFLPDEAAIYASPGTLFELWYGRNIGSGTVLEVLDDFDTKADEFDG